MFRRTLARVVPLLLVTALVVSCTGSDEAAPAPTPEKIQAADVTAVVPTGDLPEAPVFDTFDTNGMPVSSTALWAEGPVVLVFFASWCSVCVSRQGEFSALADRYQNVSKFVGVAGQEEVPELQKYLGEHPVSYPVILDSELKLWKAYAVNEPPMVALISKDGILVRGWTRGADAEEVRVELDKLLSLDS